MWLEINQICELHRFSSVHVTTHVKSLSSTILFCRIVKCYLGDARRGHQLRE